MSIPVLDQSFIFAYRIDRLVKEEFCYSRLRSKKLVNFLHKYDSNLFEQESIIFTKDPKSYENTIDLAFKKDSLTYFKKASYGLVLKVTLKFFVHRLFRWAGFFQMLGHDRNQITVLRKAYVEDVESLFDVSDNVIRFVYPFPLNIKRQIRYIKALRLNNDKYFFSGLPYSFYYLIRFMFRRSYDDLQKLETRAQLQHAMEICKLKKLRLVQCSEEYDFGSVDYSLYMQKKGVSVHNCAHGIGKYLPYHFYSVFDVLTASQKKYYKHFSKSDCTIKNISKNSNDYISFDDKKVITLLGQSSQNVSSLIYDSEIKILEILNDLAKVNKSVIFLYKKHPNSNLSYGDRYSNINNTKSLVEADSLLQISLYSTCQIDPNFLGEKILIETYLIKPSLAYGNQEPIVLIDNLFSYVQNWLGDDNEKSH